MVSLFYFQFEKSVKASVDIKQAGNHYFRQQEYTQARQKYDKASPFTLSVQLMLFATRGLVCQVLSRCQYSSCFLPHGDLCVKSFHAVSTAHAFCHTGTCVSSPFTLSVQFMLFATRGLVCQVLSRCQYSSCFLPHGDLCVKSFHAVSTVHAFCHTGTCVSSPFTLSVQLMLFATRGLVCQVLSRCQYSSCFLPHGDLCVKSFHAVSTVHAFCHTGTCVSSPFTLSVQLMLFATQGLVCQVLSRCQYSSCFLPHGDFNLYIFYLFIFCWMGC